MKVVIAVPRRPDGERRDQLWSFVRPHWEGLDLPILEGYDDTTKPFNRSACINDALKGIWDVAIVIDGDVIVDHGQVRRAVERARDLDVMCFAYQTWFALSKSGTDQIMTGYRKSWNRFIQKTIPQSRSGCFAVSRGVWEEVGGFDTLFEGWGWEDVAFSLACDAMRGGIHHREIGDLWHLYHRPSQHNNRNDPYLAAAKERGARYVAARWDPRRMHALLLEAHPDLPPLVVPDPEPLEPTLIPRILHRTVPQVTTDQVEEWWEKFQALHFGWECRTYREPLDPEDWPLTWDLWDLCTSGAQKAGLIRLEALVTHGGVYVDSDVEPYRSMEPLLNNKAFAGWEDKNVVPDAVMGAHPQHPAFIEALRRARDAVKAGEGAWYSGPGVTTGVFPGRDDVLLLPPGSFYPYHYVGKEKNRNKDHSSEQPWAFGAHHWHHSWQGR